MNYDTGNSAYWGYGVDDEIPLYGDRIGNVHIKDCTPEDYSVPLGEGNVDFDRTFQHLADVGYRGDFVLQAARAEDDVAVAMVYSRFTRRYVERYLRGS
jgi:L-ribulose-5-phosphate 3-epimerase